ncbi:cyclopropane fatty acyl phospholipid synthase [Solitalea lacus]|uniref:cyclopropane fatty acyl phospholipid synthase n=1 Tax=Solitalea lacus TaxID=2911172 RepID=UPI001EDC5423|nr:cyclopropane fatty acyl phospholipid synthase [Solitalea lacus]UKJ08869.1 cyclopropane fatty acyl phospholipid synthase [Solitalea lacus]
MKSIALATPATSFYERKVKAIIERTGIIVNGTNTFDIVVNNPHFYQRVLANGSLGLGDSYVDGWWDCTRIDEFFTKLLESGVEQKAKLDWSTRLAGLEAKVLNFQNIREAARNASFHYNLGNELFTQMLDKRLTYTCAYWKSATTLDDAQEAKLELTCKKLHLQPGMHVLDIGCGWGSFAKYAAEKYQVKVTGINVSTEQLALGRKLCKGLPIELIQTDYRKVNKQFDRIVSLGMFEHVGLKNYRTYFELINRCLKPDGLSLLHTIGANFSAIHSDPWISKYIFPNCLIPSLKQISQALENLMVIEDVHNFGPDYDKTLMAWHKNFVTNWPKLKDKYDERFYRMWTYYLLCCAGSFRARYTQLWQLVLSKGNQSVYESIR